jgi:uncharacterized membrane protein
MELIHACLLVIVVVNVAMGQVQHSAHLAILHSTYTKENVSQFAQQLVIIITNLLDSAGNVNQNVRHVLMKITSDALLARIIVISKIYQQEKLQE